VDEPEEQIAPPAQVRICTFLHQNHKSSGSLSYLRHLDRAEVAGDSPVTLRISIVIWIVVDVFVC
jgi:hypothetical protein